MFKRVMWLNTDSARRRLAQQGSKFANAEAFRIYRFVDGAWSEIILGAVMGVAVTVAYLNLASEAGQWQAAVQSSTQNHYAGSLVLLNGAAALGQIFIFLTIAWFSPVTTTMITTTRKFVTILLSVHVYGHAVTVTQWCAIATVFAGLYVAIFTTVQQQQQQRSAHKTKQA